MEKIRGHNEICAINVSYFCLLTCIRDIFQFFVCAVKVDTFPLQFLHCPVTRPFSCSWVLIISTFTPRLAPALVLHALLKQCPMITFWVVGSAGTAGSAILIASAVEPFKLSGLLDICKNCMVVIRNSMRLFYLWGRAMEVPPDSTASDITDPSDPIFLNAFRVRHSPPKSKRWACNITLTKSTWLTFALILVSFATLSFSFIMIAIGDKDNNLFYTGMISFIVGVFVPKPGGKRSFQRDMYSNNPVRSV